VASIDIRDCGPRDGLQPLEPRPPSLRAALAARLRAAGVPRVEVGSFVSAKAVPAMAHADEVLEELGPDEAWWVLVPNARGADLARGAGAMRLTVTVSASEGYSQKNTMRSVADSLDELGRIRAAVPAATLDVVISCCFGSPFDPVSPAQVAGIVAAGRDAGVDLVTLADTTGTATPGRLDDVLGAVDGEVGLHLHDSRGTALVNAYHGYLAGVRRFDTSIGGLGGSPFAPGAGGNLATEDLVLLMDELGVSTGISLDALFEAGRWLAGELGIVLPSRVAAAGALDERAR
jgi:hydroxymethylglutaryl-CoA lyase